MAGYSFENDGNCRFTFNYPKGKRRQFRVKNITEAEASFIKLRIENLLSTLRQGIEPRQAEAEWINRISPDLRKQLAKFELVTLPDKMVIPTIGEWIESYIKSRKDVSSGTITVFKQHTNIFNRFHDKTKLIDSFTELDAENFRIFMLSENYEESTVRRTCKTIKQFFTAAKKKRLIDSNPFDAVPTSDYVNEERQEYISVEIINRVIAACPDYQWRLIFALARFGGLRIPSDCEGLMLEHVLWDNDRFIVHNKKTKKYSKIREVPLFPELVPFFREAFELAETDQKYLLPICRSCTNLRTQAERIIEKSGVEVWPKIFINLRSSCETDLGDRYPERMVVKWLGHSKVVARKHYFQMTDDHFKIAAGVAQNPAQQVAESSRNDSQEKTMLGALKAISPDAYETLRNLATVCEGIKKGVSPEETHLIVPRGFEPLLPG